MKMIYQGIQRIQGYKKANGEPFDMAMCYVSVPIEAGNFGKTEKKTVITGYGLKPAELEADVTAIPKFEKVPSGTLLDLEIDQRFFMGEFKPVVVGWKQPSALAKVS